MYDRPKWLEWAERAPPLELHNMHLKCRKIKNPYPSLVRSVLRKYPTLRFQDCYVDGNDWSQGNDSYRDDHPVMQFAARQLQFMNAGHSRAAAFKKTERLFYERRMEIEKHQKIAMAMAVDERVSPLFTDPHAYWHTEMAAQEARHLNEIRKEVRGLRIAASGGGDNSAARRSDSIRLNRLREDEFRAPTLSTAGRADAGFLDVTEYPLLHAGESLDEEEGAADYDKTTATEYMDECD